MKRKSKFFKGLLLFAITLAVSACSGKDDKKNEIVEDPLELNKEYYISGTVTDANGAVPNATVTVTNDIKTTTNEKGAYTLTVKEIKAYKLTFTANEHEALEATATIASNASNRSMTIVDVKLAHVLAFGPTQPANGATIEVPKVESDTQEKAGVITIPAGGAEENTTITAVAFEEAHTAAPAASNQPQQAKASQENIAIKTEPTNAVATDNIKISVQNPSEQASQGYFNTANMIVETTNLASTRAASSKVNFENNHYVITIPKGEKIAGVYYLRVLFTKQADNTQTDSYNSVNDKEEILKIENREYDALKNIPLKVKIKTGWDYVTTPEKALQAAGASAALAQNINKYIEGEEGGKNGSYDVEKELTTNISGNHVLFYGSRRLTKMKTYTFKVMVNGQSKDIVVKLKSYAGHKEEYTNRPISQHSGGGTGTQN